MDAQGRACILLNEDKQHVSVDIFPGLENPKDTKN